MWRYWRDGKSEWPAVVEKRERFMNAERKGKEREAGWKARESSITGSTKRPICSKGGESKMGLGESTYRKTDIHPTGIPFINLACFRTTQEKNIERALFPPTTHSKLVRYDSVFFVGIVLGPGVSQIVETHGVARSASP